MKFDIQPHLDERTLKNVLRATESWVTALDYIFKLKPERRSGTERRQTHRAPNKDFDIRSGRERRTKV